MFFPYEHIITITLFVNLGIDKGIHSPCFFLFLGETKVLRVLKKQLLLKQWLTELYLMLLHSPQAKQNLSYQYFQLATGKIFVSFSNCSFIQS